MNPNRPNFVCRLAFGLPAAVALFTSVISAQVPAPANPPGRGPAAPAMTDGQQAAVGAMNQSLTPLTNEVASARNALAVASLGLPRDDAAIRAKADALAAADLALAIARADRFVRIQGSGNRLSADQIAPLATQAGQAGVGRGGRGNTAAVNPGGTGLDAARAETAKLVTPAGISAGLFAAEPMVVNPTNMDIDSRGRVWVNEGANYRSLQYTREGGDRIMILEDTNADGVADKSTVFYQDPSGNSALGIMVLDNNRAIVSLTPYIFLLTDTNNDGVADKREILFEVDGTANHDHGLHKFVFGPDGKLYTNFGNVINALKRPAPGLQVPLHGAIPAHESVVVKDLDGKEVRADGKPYRQGMVFRCNLDGSGVEVLAWNYRNVFEVSVDSFGDMWQSENDDDGNAAARMNYVMAGSNNGFQDELTGAAWMTAYRAAGSPVPERAAYHWHQMDPGVLPSLLITGAGSPTGVTVYEGSLLPAAFQNKVLHTDARPSITGAYPVMKSGAGFTMSVTPLLTPAPGEDWYRPSDVVVAPDGAVYVADWNDSIVGGHAMADQILDTMTGRIYRIAPTGNRPAVPAINLNTAAGAVAALQSPNMNTRYLAWTKLHAMQGAAEVELAKLWQTRGNDRMRARALFLLTQIKGSEKKYLDQAADDGSEDIRVVLLRAAHAAGVDVIPYVKRMAHDPSPQVRREAALALRHNPSPEVPALWVTLAQQYDGKDRWYLEALGIGADQRWDDILTSWQAGGKVDLTTTAAHDIVWRSRGSKTPGLVVAISQQPTTTAADKARLLRSLDYVTGPEKDAALLKLLTP